MSLFNHLLDEKQHLLTEKGFDEASLNSPNKAGLLFQQLRQELSDAVRESLRYQEPVDFALKAIGFFNDDKDLVLFNLHFRMDAAAGTLVIPQLDMGYNRRTLTLHFQDPSQLPHSSQAVSLFTKPQLLQRPIKENTPVKKPPTIIPNNLSQRHEAKKRRH